MRSRLCFPITTVLELVMQNVVSLCHKGDEQLLTRQPGYQHVRPSDPHDEPFIWEA